MTCAFLLLPPRPHSKPSQAMRRSNEPLLPTSNIMAGTQGKTQRKKVLIVGAGAAGMSCAHHLSEHPDKFDVTLVEAVDRCGGQAFSIPIDKEKHGASWLNQGVQGGSYIFHHTLTMFARQGFKADPVKLQVSFGKDDTFWTNVFPTELLDRHQSEIRRFVFVMKYFKYVSLFFALMPLKYFLKLCFFSQEFVNSVALPMIALFLGTGNYTDEVPAVILERLCQSPTFGMWYAPDKQTVVKNYPPMVVFPEFCKFYETWRQSLVKRGVDVRLSTEVKQVLKRDKDGVIVSIGTANTEGDEKQELYDEIVLCVLADTAKRLLSSTSSFRERKVLGSAKFSDDITVTHSDTAYIKKHYDPFFNANQAVTSLSGTDQSSRIDDGKKNFSPMYFIKQYPSDPRKLEMCFDCTNYQGQFPPGSDFESHIFQTIFLNKDRDSHLWDIDEIDESKIIRKDWWHQLCHSYTHYLFVVPWMWLLQGKKSTRFAASWTLVNAHEVAVLSGVAAAVDLGAQYPADLERDKFALLCFRLYYLLVYGKWYRRRVDKEGQGKDWASGLYGSVYQGPGVATEERRMWKEDQQE